MTPAERQTSARLISVGIGVAVALLIVVGLVGPGRADAAVDSDMTFETYVSNGLPARASLAEPADRGLRKGLPFTILPQVGYGPETGGAAGVKFEGRDLFGGNTFADVNVIYAQKMQAKGTFTLGNNRLWDNWLFYASANYFRDPSKEYFGLGNNNVGPEVLANYDIKRTRIGVTVGYRIFRRVALTVSAMYRDTDVDPGKSHKTPTLQRFAPTLPGVHGGQSNYVAAAIVYNSRDEVVRPTHGWEVIAKFLSANSALFNGNTDFSKLLVDGSYTVPLVWRRQVLALHGNVEAIFGHDSRIPFFELSSLGGDDTMRGYWPDRFLGRGRMLFNAEYRLKLVDFTLRKLWDVTIDGVAFADAGRVYTSGEDFTAHIFDHVRYDYGAGTRIGFSSGLVARIDVGFSEEEKGLVYLTFGHTF